MFSRFDESTHTFLSTHLIRPDGSGEVELPLPGPEGGGQWSHDGSLIAVMTVLEDGRIGTAIIRPDGTVERIFEIPDETLNAVCTVWSPDDMRLACEAWDDTDPSRGGVYAVRASDGGDLTRLTSAPAGMTDFPGVYWPDGSQLIIQRQTGESAGRLYIVDVAGGGEPQALFGEQTFEDVGGFSPDGGSLLTSAAGQIKLIDLDGNVLETIDDPGAYLFGPVWSPDGEWIAYSSSSGGFIADIIISRPDGSERWQVTHSSANEIVVEWGPAA
jgi:WD40 repeat protein